MAYVGNINGEPVTVAFQRDGTPTFRSDLLEGKSFDSEEKIAAAIIAYRLSLRKNFTNPNAWYFGGYRNDTPRAVTVTSVTEDGNEAWIRHPDGSRSKVKLTSLVPDKDALLATMAKERELNAQIKAEWEALPRWKPES